MHVLLNAIKLSVSTSIVQIGRASKSIHNRMPHLSVVQERQEFSETFQKGININIPAMTKISIDMKQIPQNHGYTHILVLLCEVSNYMVALPLHSTKTPHILDVFQRGYLAYFVPPSHIICDQDPAFTSSLMEAFAQSIKY